jgi:hypothetical protein
VCRRLRRIATTVLTAAVVLVLCGFDDGASSHAGFFSDARSKLFGGGSTSMALAPIVGAPANITQQLTDALVSAGQERKLTLVPGGTGGSYTLRGYLVASAEKSGAKISYIWDVSDAKGQRVARVSGDEVITKRSGADPWSGVDSAALHNIAAKTTSQVLASLSGGGSAPVASDSPPPASPSPGLASPPGSSRPPTSASPGLGASPPAPAASAATEPPGEIMALVAPVSGAPGDGQKSLTAALKKRLFAGGVKLASAPARNVYTVKGTVVLADTTGGKQSIRIDWLVFDPNGKKLGTVSQQNTIPKGALNGPWGAIADAAAGAAANGIIKLIPRSNT